MAGAFPDLSPYHDTRMGPVIQGVYDVVARTGLNLPGGIRDVTVVPPEHHGAVRALLKLTNNHGRYFPGFDRIVVMRHHDPDAPELADIDLLADLGHELGHRGTHSSKGGPLIEEGLAGFAELAILDRLRGEGKAQSPQRAAILTGSPDREGLIVPSQYRRYEHPKKPGAHTTQGLVAASVIDLAMRATGEDTSELLRVARPGSEEPYEIIHDSLRTIRPGLERQVFGKQIPVGTNLHSPEGTARIFQSARAIQDELRKQGHTIE